MPLARRRHRRRRTFPESVRQQPQFDSPKGRAGWSQSDQSFVEPCAVSLTAAASICTAPARYAGVTCPEPHGAFYAFPSVAASFGRHYQDQVWMGL